MSGEHAAKYPIAHYYYDGEITSEMAYQIGLWATDGCIYHNVLYLGMVDKTVVDYIRSILSPFQPLKYKPEKEFVGSNGKTYIRKPSYAVAISSKYLRASLMNRFGIYPRKSLTFTGPLSIESYSQRLAYLKGAIEGDGWMKTYEKTKREVKLGMCGTYEHCVYVQGLFEELFGIERNIGKVTKKTFKVEVTNRKDFLTVRNALKSIPVGNDSRKFSKSLPNWLT